MRHSRRLNSPLPGITETLVRRRFELVRQNLRSGPSPIASSTPTPADWVLLARIQELLDYAFSTGDWRTAKTEIEALKRRAQMHIVVEQPKKP